MFEIITRAVSAEAAIYAVQAGADAVYFSTEDCAPRTGKPSLTADELPLVLRYCRVRGCRVYAELDVLASDLELPAAAAQAEKLCRMGVQGLIVHDLGLACVLRRTLPDIPLIAGLRLDLHSTAGALAAAEMGFSYILLAPELSLDEIARIAGRVPVPVLVLGQGPSCIAHRGQCLLSALSGSGRDSCGRCARPCREKLSMGMLSPEYPLAQKDLCLAGRIPQLKQAGVSGVLLDGIDPLYPELAGRLTQLYALTGHSGRHVLPDEIAQLQRQLYPGGLTHGWIDGEAGADSFGLPQPLEREGRAALSQVRRALANEELRRVPVEFAAVGRQTELELAVRDADGHQAVVRVHAGVDPIGAGVSRAAVEDRLQRTAGTPYHCSGVQTARLEHITVLEEQLDEGRRSLLAALTEQRSVPPAVRVRPMPSPPPVRGQAEPPVMTVQVRSAEQLTPELAALCPALVYVPLEELSEHFGAVGPFLDAGVRVAAVLPRAMTDGEMPEVARLLRKLRSLGVDEVLAGNLGHIAPARIAGFRIHGDFGLNLASWPAVQLMREAQLETVTASLELSLTAVAAMAKPVGLELIVYGRVPVMLTDHCLIKMASGGRCVCQKGHTLRDRKGGVYPVLREFGCRNEILARDKLFLGDRRADWEHIGLWGARLYFTTESPRECVEVTRAFCGQTAYVPNNISRGLYDKGAGI
ncbi:MAG: U32 family peptidase [Clostridiales bacterium]|nr:U32 family peptidase [Clostridiales bacterium]